MTTDELPARLEPVVPSLVVVDGQMRRQYLYGKRLLSLRLFYAIYLKDIYLLYLPEERALPERPLAIAQHLK